MKKTLQRIVRMAVHFPKTLLLNILAFPLPVALRFPIVLMSGCTLKGINRGCIEILAKPYPGMIRYGTNSSSVNGLEVKKKSTIYVKEKGKIVFKGPAVFGKGSAICTSGILEFGDNFSCNINSFFACDENMSFGDEVLIGWNCRFRDNDGHPIRNAEDQVINAPRKVTIGNHVWIASYVDVLKGTVVPNHCVVGYRSLLCKRYDEEATIIAGSPASVVKRNIKWSIS